MLTVTLGDMRSDLADALNLPAFTTMTSITTARANYWLNRGVKELFVLVVEAAGHDAFEKTAQFQMVAQQTDYTLPQDFYELLSVRCLLDSSGSTQVPLERYPLSDEPYLLSSPPSNYGEPFRFRELGKTVIGGSDGGSIRFLPAPSTATRIQIQYVFAPTLLVQDDDTLDGFAGFDDYAVQFAAYRCASKTDQRERAASYLAEMMRIKDNVLAAMRSRDSTMCPRVNQTRSAWGPPRAARWGRWR